MGRIQALRPGYALLLIALVPLLMSEYSLSIATEILIFGILALSLNILVGYTGLVSLGHAAFFGVGAYTSSLVALHVSQNLFFSLIASILVSMLLAAVIGFLCNKVSGFYFLMLTLAFSQMIYAFVFNWGSFTGGDNGLSGIPRPSIGLFSLEDSRHLYLLILVVFGIVVVLLDVLVRSPLGQVWIGIRENEARMRAIGYNTARYKHLAFVLAGTIGGVAGSLYAYFNGFVSPKDMYWTLSGEVLIMVLIGGSRSLPGPVLGAAFLVILETWMSSYTDLWMLIIGMAFILFVVFVPDGIAGIGTRLMSRPGKYVQEPLMTTAAGDGVAAAPQSIQKEGVES
jgi:branched-chain amino acid transport system permease protein